MPTRGQIKEVIDSWQGWLHSSLRESRHRDLSLTFPEKGALALIGVRRSGKSFAAANLIGPQLKSTFFMNFEDPFFLQNNVVSLLDEFLSVFTEYSQKAPQFLFLDEIQNLEGWERWVRKMVDQKKFRIVITGSSAKMLSSELATSLTGRCVSQTIWPLSFRESLRFRDISCTHRDEYLGALRNYLQWGGFPEVTQLSAETHKMERLRQYLTDVLYKDVLKRYEIRSSRSLEQVARFYLTNISCLHSYNSLRKAFGLNVETVADYTRFLQDAFLLFEVQRFHPNLKVQSRDPKKIYTVDTGLRNANASSPQEDLGKLAENVVYIQLRRMGHEVTYFKGEGEVDFVLSQFGKPQGAVQVCYDDLQEEKTWNRETGSLIECLKVLKLSDGILLTLKREETFTESGKKIRLIPLYQWLLQD